MYAVVYGNFECAALLIRQFSHRENGKEVYINHCEISGLNLYDNYGKNALYYAVFSSMFDREIELIEKRRVKKIYRDQRSLREESLFIFNLLREAGARFGSAWLYAQALELAAYQDRSYIVARMLSMQPGSKLARIYTN